MTINLAEHMMNLKGRHYLPVAPRIVAFREEHPAWAIITEATEIGQAQYCRASVLDDAGRVVATAHKVVTSFAGGAFEKAETGAIGRALSLCGYGTLAALDMDEGEDIADAPVQAPARQAAVRQAQPPAKPKPAASPPGDGPMWEDASVAGPADQQVAGVLTAIAGAQSVAELDKLGREIASKLAPAQQLLVKGQYKEALGALRRAEAVEMTP